eukprot:scaffold81317_cov68-Cyclotella_meneghiniana.AAC.4
MSRHFNSSNNSRRDPFVKGNAVQLDPATIQSIRDREESKSVQEELRSIQRPATSPFSEIFFDGMPDAEMESGVVAEKSSMDESIDFDDAFMDSSTKPLTDDNPELLYDMDTDDQIPLQWTKTRIVTREKTASALSNSKSNDERISLTKQMLSTAQVIAQVEDKFIIIKTQGKLCIVDQHAADERVALEKLEHALFHPNFSEGMRIELTKKHMLVGDILKATPVMPAKRVVLTKSQMESVQQHRRILFKWHFTYKPPSTGEESILLTGVPSICGRVTDVCDFVDFVNELQFSRGEQVKPECVKRILASQACRYAIMFGDKLTDEQCSKLISNLSKCDMAFICAHGRPSVIPLLDLEEAETNTTTKIHLNSHIPNVRETATVRGSRNEPMRVIRKRADIR